MVYIKIVIIVEWSRLKAVPPEIFVQLTDSDREYLVNQDAGKRKAEVADTVQSQRSEEAARGEQILIQFFQIKHENFNNQNYQNAQIFEDRFISHCQFFGQIYLQKTIKH